MGLKGDINHVSPLGRCDYVMMKMEVTFKVAGDKSEKHEDNSRNGDKTNFSQLKDILVK